MSSMSFFRFPVLGSFIIGVLSAHTALADANPYDGSYAGTATVTSGSQPVCGSDGNVSLVVQDGKVDYKFGDFPLKSTVSADGHFRNIVHVGKKGRRALRTRGTITNGILEADLRSRDFTGDLCSYHWSLHKQ